MASKKYAVLGLGRFARTLAAKLYEQGAEVIAADINSDLVEQMKESVTLAVKMDTTDPKALIEQGIDKVDIAIVGMGDEFEPNVLTTFALKQIGVKKVIVKSAIWTRSRILEKVGADEVISPEKDSAERMADKLMRPGIEESLVLPEGHRIVQIPVPERFAGKPLAEIDARNKYKVNIVAILKDQNGKNKKSKGSINDIPSADDILEAGCKLFVIGAENDISDFMGTSK